MKLNMQKLVRERSSECVSFFLVLEVPKCAKTSCEVSPPYPAQRQWAGVSSKSTSLLRSWCLQSTAYDQAMVQLLHYPDLWCEFALWHQEGGGGGAAPALAVLGRARQVCHSKFPSAFRAPE